MYFFLNLIGFTTLSLLGRERDVSDVIGMKVVDVVGVQKHLLFQGRKRKRRGGQKYILKGVAGCQRRLLDDELFLCWLRLLPHWRERERESGILTSGYISRKKVFSFEFPKRQNLIAFGT